MAGTTTLTMIKPDAVRAGNLGNILRDIEAAGFTVRAMRYYRMSPAVAGTFYEVHKGRPFYDDLVEFMSSGPIVAAVLDGTDAVASFRELIGATNPADAKEGTLRAKYAESIGENAVHGSDSDENAAIEASFHFAGREIY